MRKRRSPSGRPTEGEQSPPRPKVVGIGASAGGLAALRAFFENVHPDTGLAYVVVVHLSPEHESHLPELLQSHVRMPIQQVRATVPLEPDHVYVIPPNANLSAIDTHLRLSDLEARRTERAPIDHFFRTLAATHDGEAVAVILTGTGSDGALGIKEIKEHGGVTIVQDPADAEYDGMPVAAMSTGLVDLVLPLDAIPDAIRRVTATSPQITVPADGEEPSGDDRQVLQKIFAQLRSRTRRDFSRYKRSTLLRRISRRMQLRGEEELAAYLELLRKNEEEVHALADDLLITVTRFFRDAAVWEYLSEETIPALFEGKRADDDIRVWSVGCATGEEAYSLAILLLEEAGRRQAAGRVVPRIQVFASDLHERSLEHAREGFYPGDIQIDVSQDRLQQFFQQVTGGFRIRREVREHVVFAPHNLLADPPFSRLDLVSSRNILIYLLREVQREVIDVFHYALNPGGMLVLGTSETVEGGDLFRVVDKRLAIFSKRNVASREPRLPVFPTAKVPQPLAQPPAARSEEPLQAGELYHRMVERHGPPLLLITPDDNVVHLSAHASRYLAQPGGRPTFNIHQAVPEGLRADLRSAVHEARQTRQPTGTKPRKLVVDGRDRYVSAHVTPSSEPDADGYLLVTFDEREPAPVSAPDGEKPKQGDEEAASLRAELDQTHRRLQVVLEEYEASREEMRASNEELQSANEELRSTLEELETSKEELQSMNEELQTVNQENRHKVEELSRLSSDLQNLMASTDVATIFLDRELRITRYTPKVEELFSLRLADRGRPLADITHRFGTASLIEDAEAALRRLQPAEREVQAESGRWYLNRVAPYTSEGNRIAGVVITFVDITGGKQAEEEIRESEAGLERRIAIATTELRDLSSQLLLVQEKERQHVARELHDEIGQALTALQLRLTGTSVGGDELKEAADQVREVTRRVSELSMDLRPEALDTLGLVPAVVSHARRFGQRSGLEIDVQHDGLSERLAPEVEIAAYRIVQEALTNVARHAGTDRASVRMVADESTLTVVVLDEGRGFDVGSPAPAGGIGGMRERARLIGGRIEIYSTPGEGTSVHAELPLAPQPPHADQRMPPRGEGG